MLSIYINYPTGKISKHYNPDCAQIQKMKKHDQRVIQIDRLSIESEVNKLEQAGLKFASFAGLNDVWIHIDLGDSSNEDNLASTIHEILSKYNKRLARAEIKIHCTNPERKQMNSHNHTCSLSKASPQRMIGGKETIPNREKKIEEIITAITLRIAEFNSLYRSGPSLYFYRRIIELRKKHRKIADFLSNNYSLEILYATLVSWDMNSRGAKLKYFDEFKDSINSCHSALEAIEGTLEIFNPTLPNEMLGLLKSAFLGIELMETSRRLVSNSKCLHFLFPSLCMPMDGTNTLQYLFGNTNESVNRYLDVIRFSFDVMRQPVQFDKYLDDHWNQSVPKLIDNAIILLSGKSIKINKEGGRGLINKGV